MDPNLGMQQAERILIRESPGSELDSMVGMDKASWSWFALVYRPVKGIDDQLWILNRIIRPTNNFSAARVQNVAAVHFSFAIFVLWNVLDPQFI